MDKIIWVVACCCCGFVFFYFGFRGRNQKEPMSFLPDKQIPASKISDVAAYNRAYGAMWMVYSLPFWVSGILFIWYKAAAAVILVASVTIGLALVVYIHKRIDRKYTR